MVKVTFEFDSKEEAATFLVGGSKAKGSKKKEEESDDDDDLIGDSEPEEETEKPVTLAVVTTTIQKVANAGKKPAIKKLLAKHGATGGASTLPKANLKKFHDDLLKIDLD